MENKFLIVKQYNEEFLLPIFLKHYCQYFKPQNIFVVDHGSNKNMIPNEFNKIYIPREGLYSDQTRLDFIKDLSNALLKYYDLGVYVDCDELISFEGVNFSELTDPITYVVGFDCFWNESNNLIGLINPLYCKPLIFRQTPNWQPGFHTAYNDMPKKPLSIPLAHIRWLYKEQCSIRAEQRKVIYNTEYNKNEKEAGWAFEWGKGTKEIDEFYEHIQLNINNTTYQFLKSIEPQQVFNKLIPASYADSNNPSVTPKGDWKIYKENFYNLTQYFPSLKNI